MSLIGNKSLEDIIRKIAKEQDLKIPQVEHIVDSQFRFINEQIESNEFKNISVMFLGKFVSNGIYQAKQRGEYKYGRFVKKDKGDNSGILAPVNIQEQQDKVRVSEKNKNL